MRTVAQVINDGELQLGQNGGQNTYLHGRFF